MNGFLTFSTLSALVAGGHPQAADTVRSYDVAGRVVQARGGVAPVTGATVLMSSPRRRTATAGDGTFTIRDIPPGPVTLRVEASGYIPSELVVDLPEAAAQELRIVLDPVVFQLDEVVATASPVGDRALYQPARAYAGEELRRRSASSFGEMLDGEPGVAMRSMGPAPGRPVIRGLDGDRLLILENGERTGDLSETAADHAISVDPLAAERVEVVRGPASLLYGSSALGGVVNVISADLPRNWAPGTEASLAGHAASVNRSGTASGSVVHGRDLWAMSGRFSYRGAGDLSTPRGRLPGTFSERLTGAVGLGLGGQSWTGGISLSMVDHAYGLPEELDDPDEEVEIRMDRSNVQGQLRWESPDPGRLVQGVELRANASRYFHEEIARSGVTHGGGTEAVDLDFLQHALSSTLTITHGSIGPAEHGALGFSLFSRELRVAGEEGLTPDGRSDFFASFLYEEVPLTASLRLQLGARAEFQEMRARANERFPGFSNQRRTATYSGSVGLHVQPVEGLEIGAQVARAHRAPMIEELYSDAAHLGTGAYEIGNPALRNEIGHGFDLFARFATDRMQAELAGFHNRISNYVILTPTGETHGPSGFPVHRFEADDAALTGGELSIDALLLPRLRARAGADYVRGDRRGLLREPLPFIPPIRSTLALTYDRDVWWFGGTTRLVGRQGRVSGGERPTSGYTLLRLEAGYRHLASGRHLLILRLDNALDAVYHDHLSRVENRGFPMPGRNLNLIYRLAF